MMVALRQRHDFSEFFIAYVLLRNIRDEADLVDQLFNSTEKRLARVLLLLAHYGKEGQPERIVPKVSHEALAQMLGTTRPEVSHFMNKFRTLGFIEYNGRSKGRLEVHRSLLNMILHK
jgi:CRP-like cAMP-binding protein